MKRSRYEDDSATLHLAQESGQKANKLPRSEASLSVTSLAFVNGQLISKKIIFNIISFKCFVGVQNADYYYFFFFTRNSVNGGCFSDNASVSSAGLVAIFIMYTNFKEKQSVTEEDRVSSSVQLEEEDWHSKLHPFPETQFPKELPVVAATYNLPQKPVVKLARIGSAQELGIAWTVDQKDPHVAEMDCYYIYVSHENKSGTFSGWKCLGEIKAMPLPMACKVSDCKGDKRLCFIVVGKDIFGRYGPYSDIRTVASGQI
uniref:Activating transcription factor 7-interacting protein 1-like n=1 Tax=Sinocyclocheilus grahami TaxID=75366 RepID=A0A672RZ64_SINGR